MNQLTAFLAAAIAGTHLAFIFWPRKPLSVPTDKEGRPILWHNDDEQSEDVTCVWPGASEPQSAPAVSSNRELAETQTAA